METLLIIVMFAVYLFLIACCTPGVWYIPFVNRIALRLMQEQEKYNVH